MVMVVATCISTSYTVGLFITRTDELLVLYLNLYFRKFWPSRQLLAKSLALISLTYLSSFLIKWSYSTFGQIHKDKLLKTTAAAFYRPHDLTAPNQKHQRSQGLREYKAIYKINK